MRPEPQPKSSRSGTVTLIVAIGLLALLGYQVFNGVVFQKIGFGPLKIELATPAPRSPETTVAQKDSATRDFLIGHWQTGLPDGHVFDIEFHSDGSTSDWNSKFQRDKSSGYWDFTPLDNYNFCVTTRNLGQIQIGPGDIRNFVIQDHDHIRDSQGMVWKRLGW
jgi:hypothetical protein